MGSFIDDRCPTVWQFALEGRAEAADERRIFSGGHTKQSSPVPATVVRDAAKTRCRDETPRSEARKEPLDGNLLMKLYRATVDDRRRSAEAIGKQNDSSGTDANDALRETPALEPQMHRGFFLPKGISREPGDEAHTVQDERPVIHTEKPPKKKKAAKQSSAKPAEGAPEAASTVASIHSNKSVRVVGKNGEETFVEMPNLPLVIEESPPGSRAQGFEQIQEPPKEAEPKLSKKQKKKMKKGKEQQNQNRSREPEAAAQHERQDEPFEEPAPTLSKKQQKKKNKQEQKREEDAAEAAGAFMSGALPEEITEKQSKSPSKHSEKFSNVGWEGVFDAPVHSHSEAKESHRTFQPTVESAPPSRASRKGDRVSKSPLQKASSFVGFEEIGRGFYEPSIHSSQKARSKVKPKSPSMQGFEEVRESTPRSRKSSAKVGSRVTSAGSRRSANHFDGVSLQEPQNGWIQMPAIIKSVSVRSQSKSQSRAVSITDEQLAERLWHETASVDSKSRASLASRNGKPVAEANGWASNAPGKNLFNGSPVAPRRSNLAGEDEWVELKPQEQASAHWPASHRSKERSSKDSNSPLGNQSLLPARSDHSVEQARATFSAQGHSHHSRRSRVVEDFAFQEVQGADTIKTPSPLMFKEITQHESKEHGGEDSFRVPSTHDWATGNAFDVRSQRLSDVGSKTSSRSSKQREHVTAQTTHSELRSRHSHQRSSASSARLTSVHGPWEQDSESHASASQEPFPAFNAAKVGSTSDGRIEEPYVRPPTVFAGKGWISPHPLSRSPTELASPPQSKIVLPSEAFPQGATMTYEEWKDMQERGMRMHRNFSHTESSHGRTAKLADRRYMFPGWRREQTHRPELEQDGPAAEGSAIGTASYHVPTVESQHSSQRTGSRLSRHSSRHQEQYDKGEHRRSRHSEHRSSRLSQAETFSQSSRHSSGHHETSHSASNTAIARSERSSHHSGRPGHAGRASSSRHSRHSDIKIVSQGSHCSSGFRDHSRLASNIATLRSDRGQEKDERSSHQSSHRSSHRSSRHNRLNTISEASRHTSRHHQSHHSSGHASSQQSNRRSIHSHTRSASGWNQKRSSLGYSEHGSTASRSSSERITAAMEEGRNVWSNVPQYDGTVSDGERSQGHDARSETATSQLYFERYRETADSSGEEW